jgi:large subunit ribosomal protein L6
MSRIGKQPIELPSGVKAEIAGRLLKIKGPKGEMSREIRPEISAAVEDGKLVFTRCDEEKQTRAYHGLERALASNMVTGVSKGFERQLELVGVGYRVEENGKNLLFSLGYSHPIDFPIPVGIKASLLKEGRETFVKLEGADKQLLGETAARIKALRPPEPYKGKGVRYRGEVIKTKAGKAGKK